MSDDQELITRVARAIFESSGRTTGDERPIWGELDEMSRQTFRLHARAAIAAMPAVVSGGQTNAR